MKDYPEGKGGQGAAPEGKNALLQNQRRHQKQRARQQFPFMRKLCQRLVALLVLLAAGFGILEAAARQNPAYAVTVHRSLGSLAGVCAIAGVPLLVVCVAQLWRIRRGKSKEAPLLYKVSGGIALAILGGLLLAFGITRLLGV